VPKTAKNTRIAAVISTAVATMAMMPTRNWLPMADLGIPLRLIIISIGIQNLASRQGSPRKTRIPVIKGCRHPSFILEIAKPPPETQALSLETRA
jgi:hypothetical protein